tara:strand:+ start:1287 stop:1478 length:192 start_codon:yes stop_codon:yes gene_type:complete
MNVENIESVKKLNGYDGTLQSYKVICKDNNSRVYLVPLESANTDYQAIQEWDTIDGNNIEDAD